jgi:uncharacterized protein (TIGR02145 family)
MKSKLVYKIVLSVGVLIAIHSCKKESPVTVKTSEISSVGAKTAISGGIITENKEVEISSKGVVWSINPNPTILNDSTLDGSGTSNFTSNITGLNPNKTYYVRAYATNSEETYYGDELSFTTNLLSSPGAGVTYSGRTYSTVVFGNDQEWMAENLRTSVYSNGDPIPNVTNSNQWSSLTSGAWVHLNNSNSYENTYGKLYNWYTVSDSRNLCPTGWHVPTDDEWTTLTDYLGGEPNADEILRSVGTQYWRSPNTGATNESGFNGLPAGFRTESGNFTCDDCVSKWWSSTDYQNDAISRQLSSTQVNGVGGLFIRTIVDKNEGYSVRCLKN